MAGPIDADERTNALGLFNTARSYWRSAEYLNAAEIEVTHPQAPATFLFCHAVELYLKAYLRGAGKSITELKKLSHRVADLATAALEIGLSLVPEHKEILSHIDNADVAIEARYIVTGFKNLPTNEALSCVAQSLDQTVGDALTKTGLPIRQGDFESPKPHRASGLENDTKRVLVELFISDEMEDRDVGAMAMRLGLSKGVMQYHLDRLEELGFADISGSHPDLGHVYWYLLPGGRCYVVEQKLV
jgi:hypothetical protein